MAADKTTHADEFAKATPRPWSPDPHSSPVLVRCRFEVVARIERRNDRPTEEADAALIARAVNAYEPMRLALRQVEHVRMDDPDTGRPEWRCPECLRGKHELHATDCVIRAALRAADGATEGT